MSGDPNTFDCEVQRLRDTGDCAAAAQRILQRFGADVLRVLVARLRDDEHANEVFARFAEALWMALPRFAFRCSVRAWVFVLARNSANRYLQRDLRRARRQVSLSRTHPLALQVQTLQTETKAHLRTENKQRLAAARAELSDDDQLLLTLRIDRQLEFREIASVMLGDAEADDAALLREAARLRKRLQAIKEKLRRLLV